MHGELGEKLVNHYEFYSAFISNEEYRIESNGKSLGSISLKNPLTPNMGLIFAGRRWRVLEINSEAKIIMVMPDKGELFLILKTLVQLWYIVEFDKG